ncbi:MAG: hypothetical protein HQM10_12265 [Candidatus Riflebacteria bacterium]|nr:hypothetical protein [Candidatus Riflebacteria bacterium]
MNRTKLDKGLAQALIRAIKAGDSAKRDRVYEVYRKFMVAGVRKLVTTADFVCSG